MTLLIKIAFTSILVWFLSGTPNAQDAFKVVSFEELEVYFNKQNDTLYVINFWATWCKPCLEELPYFEAFHEKYTHDKVKVLLVSVDFKSQIESRVKPFLERKQLKSEVWLLDAGNPNIWIEKVDESWSGAIPATLFLKGDKRKFEEKEFESLEDLESIFDHL
jgi:thiol-disulfide isomerase/thioredoxin